MAKRAHATTVEVNASHVAYMSHPKEAAKLIEEAAASPRRVIEATLPLASCFGTRSRVPKQVRNRIHGASTMENQVIIESPDGTFHAYVSRAAKLPAPAVVVLQELFGVNADIRATARSWRAGIHGSSDMFWRQEPTLSDVRPEADWQHGLRLYGAYDRDASARDMVQTIAPPLRHPESTGKVALQGYASAR